MSFHSLNLKSQAHSDRRQPDHRQRRRHWSSTSPPSTIRHHQCQSHRQCRRHRSQTLTSVSMLSQAANQFRPHRRSTLLASNPPTVPSRRSAQTHATTCLRPTPSIGVLAHGCACLWLVIFYFVCDWWFCLVWVEEKDWRFGFFFFFFGGLLLLVVVVVVGVVVVVADGRGGCGWCCGFFWEVGYIILL